MWIVVGVVSLGALMAGVPWLLKSLNTVSTDDAYVAGDLVNVSPVISGTLKELTVDEGSYVHRGQLIARLSDASPQANVRQAHARSIRVSVGVTKVGCARSGGYGTIGAYTCLECGDETREGTARHHSGRSRERHHRRKGP